MKYEAFLLPWI